MILCCMVTITKPFCSFHRIFNESAQRTKHLACCCRSRAEQSVVTLSRNKRRPLRKQDITGAKTDKGKFLDSQSSTCVCVCVCVCVHLTEHDSFSLQFSRSVVSDSLQPHGLQHARPPCPSPTPGACSNSCPSSRRCHPAISSSVILSSSCLESFSAS